MAEREQLRVAYVEWSDASSVGAVGWQDLDAAVDRARTAIDAPAMAAGLLLEETPTAVVLALMHDPAHDDVAQVVAIPRSAIVRMERWTP